MRVILLKLFRKLIQVNTQNQFVLNANQYQSFF